MHGNDIAWVASPTPGIDRRMLERDGDEVARATSLVRYAQGSRFPAHTHGAGEEFLVLDGVFSDETGDFPAGWYVRNPPGSHHSPASRPGAVILVKLRQMPAEETARLRLDTHDPAIWRQTGPGIEQASLFDAPWEQVSLLRLAAGYQGPPETWPRGAEFFVIDGNAVIGSASLAKHGWARFPAGSHLAISSDAGALMYRKTGHLP